jgi:hypothetical protein
MELDRVALYVAQGWLEYRGIEERDGHEPIWTIQKFREKSPKWLSSYHSTVSGDWAFCDYKLMSGGDPEIYDEPLPLEEFMELAEGYFSNALNLFELAEQSALDPAYEPSSEELLVVDNRRS